MTNQLVAAENYFTLIQIKNVNQSISVVEKTADSIKIPGASLFFKYVTFVLNQDDPSEAQQILNKLERIESKLDNAFSITLSALDINNLRVNTTNAKSSMDELTHIVKMDQDAGGDYSARIQEEVKNLHKIAEEQIHLGKYALVDFESAQSTGNGELLSLIGKYLKISSLVAETISCMQYSYNTILQRNLKMEELLGAEFKGTEDYKTGKEIEDYSKTILDRYNSFLSEDMPRNVPKWCKKIFLGESFNLKNRWNGDYLRIANGNMYSNLDCGSINSARLRLSLDEDVSLWDMYSSDPDTKEAKVFSSDASEMYRGTVPLLMWCKNSKQEKDKKDKYSILYDFESIIIEYPRKNGELVCIKKISYPNRNSYPRVVPSKIKTTDEKAQWLVV
ncbi:hypothetical protein [Marinomonas algicola]|uniref:hypothetical protein n=1 Tax=Marinomonas algicola TaxID=2773454 RepID=UPI00174C9D32|nr:hypothetical protein [Marinomonas algicola]